MTTEKIQRTYNVPLRKEWLKAQKYKRAKKAVTALREFLQHHMKSDDVHLGRYLNEAIWKRGMQNPPHHIKVDVLKENNKVVAELSGKPLPEIKKEERKGVVGKALEKLRGAPKQVAAKEQPTEEKPAL